MTSIVDIIGDIEILRVLLEGVFAEWKGTFDVMSAEPPPLYLFDPSPGFADFCRKIRSTPEGDSLCVECDQKHAELAAKRGRASSYMCHAGMLDIATPILVNGEPVATIFCGQRRSWNEGQERTGIRRAKETARRLGLEPGELLSLRRKERQVSRHELEDIKQRLDRVAVYVAATGKEKLDLRRIRNEMLRESQLIQNVMNALTTIVDVDTFWSKLDLALDRICDTIGANYAAVFAFEQERDASYRLRSMAGLAHSNFKEVYPGNETTFERMTGQMEYSIFDFDSFPADKRFCDDLEAAVEEMPEKVAAVPFDLSSGFHAVMVFFLTRERDIKRSLPIEREVDILSQIAPQIATAYQNCVLYTERKDLAKEKDIFLEDLGHQLIAPLSSLQADSDRLHRYFDEWDQERIESHARAIREISRGAARLTRNIMWIATEGRHGLLNRREVKMAPFLIGCAIDVQGMAGSRGIRVHVEEQSVDALPRLSIDRERFHQALVNILDNAVKYAKRGSEIRIDAEQSESEVRISVTNYGIPLREEDIEKIFERGWRSEEAENMVPGGTGIGLPVAREIVRLHGGELLASPSTYDREWGADKAVFTMEFPVKPKEA